MDSDECDKDVYNDGKVLAIVDLPKNDANRITSQASKESGQRIDWHFVAGRVVIKVLGDAQKAADALYPNLPGYDG